MREVYKIADNIISSLGFSTEENYRSIVSGAVGIKETKLFSPPEGVKYLSLTDRSKLAAITSTYTDPARYTLTEQMIISSIHDATAQTDIDLTSSDTLIVISTVKGNIDLIREKDSTGFSGDRVHLWRSAEEIRKHFGNPNRVVLISSACISGTLALVYAQRVLQGKRFNNVVVTGADMISQFVVSGFECLKALDNGGPCRPFDYRRSGLSLGEGAATLVLSVNKQSKRGIAIVSGASTNDANHISGPSRTGEGLYKAIERTISDASTPELSFINSHGTATIFNDEMESIAFSRSGMSHIPVNSFKGYLGHTLGAAGIIETALCCKSLENNILIPSIGYEKQGTSEELNIITVAQHKELSSCLKTSSGFGGTNATLLLKKYSDER